MDFNPGVLLKEPAFPTFGWEWTNPLAYFNAAGFILGILILRHLNGRRDGSSNLVEGAWWATLVLAIGTGLHLAGDFLAVPEDLDHQFIHFVLMVALIVFFVFAKRGD